MLYNVYRTAWLDGFKLAQIRNLLVKYHCITIFLDMVVLTKKKKNKKNENSNLRYKFMDAAKMARLLLCSNRRLHVGKPFVIDRILYVTIGNK